MQMYNNTIDIVSGCSGVALSVIGMQADGIFATVAAIASAINAVFLCLTLCVRLFMTIKNRITKKTTDEQFVGELEQISDEAAAVGEILQRKEDNENG